MTVEILVDGTRLPVAEGENLLTVLRRSGRKVPAVCYHPALRKPSAACRLCQVSVKQGDDPPKIRRACIVKTRSDMEVVTDGEEIRAARSKAMNTLLAQAPLSDSLIALATEYGLDTRPVPDGCIRCHLCHKVCEEVVGANALEVVHRDGRPFVVPVEGRCIGCGTCANICSTGHIRIKDEGNVRTILIRDEVIGRHPLERCEGCGRRYATPRFLHHVERRTEPHPHVKEFHHYCPTCAKLFSDRIRGLG